MQKINELFVNSQTAELSMTQKPFKIEFIE